MEYLVLRSKRKTLSVSVKDGKVIVRAPMTLSAQKIEEFVHKHRLWIARRLKEQAERQALELSDGSRVVLFGIERVIRTGRARLTSETLFLPQENREQALIRILRELTRERMTEFTEKIASRYGFRYEKIRITSARTRWGSCNAEGTIAFTFRTAFLPIGIAVYLAVHELCHTRHMDHSKAFWGLVESIIPDYRERRRTLKRYSWVMQCL